MLKEENQVILQPCQLNQKLKRYNTYILRNSKTFFSTVHQIDSKIMGENLCFNLINSKNNTAMITNLINSTNNTAMIARERGGRGEAERERERWSGNMQISKKKNRKLKIQHGSFHKKKNKRIRESNQVIFLSIYFIIITFIKDDPKFRLPYSIRFDRSARSLL